MWQVLLTAAVAGSTSLVAKHLFNPFSQQTQKETSTEIDEPITPPTQNGFLESGYDSNEEQNDGIFRFSSSGSGDRPGSRKKNSRVRAPRSRKSGSFDSVGRDKIEKRSGCAVEVSRRRVYVCLKKRRTCKNLAASKCGSCLHEGNSLFSWGLGVGIMYMMSAGKSEIGKLNVAMDETARVVQELKQELNRRKSLRDLPCHGYEITKNSKKNSRKDNQDALKKPGFAISDDGEYPSSVLTEEPEPEMVEMDRLETELESELQKLNLTEREDPESYQCGGILPSELDNKLCHLLIEQQEDQIEELESELHTAQSKLQQKETELQALKDCVKRLTNFSLSIPSDDEPEPKQEQDSTNSWNHTKSKPRKALVGMKRPVDS